MCNLLQLHPQYEEALSITVFASQKSNIVNTTLVEFEVDFLHNLGKTLICANSVDQIA